MDKLLTFAYAKLKETKKQVFDKSPPAGTEYPFIQYEINIPFRNVNPLLADLTIDVWDRSNTTFTVETLTNEIDGIFEDLNYSDNYIQVKVKRQNRLKIEDEDAEIKRRQLKYQLRTFYKE